METQFQSKGSNDGVRFSGEVVSILGARKGFFRRTYSNHNRTRAIIVFFCSIVVVELHELGNFTASELRDI